MSPGSGLPPSSSTTDRKTVVKGTDGFWAIGTVSVELALTVWPPPVPLTVAVLVSEPALICGWVRLAVAVTVLVAQGARDVMVTLLVFRRVFFRARLLRVTLPVLVTV